MTAIRLTFDVVEGKPKYRAARRLQMRVPPEQNIPNMGKGSGLWIELRDGEGTSIYRRLIDAEAFQTDTEIRTGASDRPFSRRVTKRGTTVFNAVIPDDPRGKSFHILQRRAGSPGKKPEELAHVDVFDI